MATLLVASVSARVVASVSVDECSARFPQLIEAALDAKMEWEARNAPLEEQARRAANRIAATLDAATGSTGYEAFRQSLLAQAEADAARKVRETVIANLEAAAGARRLEICRDLVRSVLDGKLDLRVTQPNAYRLLQNAR